MATKRKVSQKKFLTGVVACPELCFTKAELYQLYQEAVDIVIYSSKFDGSFITMADVLDTVDEAAFSEMVRKFMNNRMKSCTATDILTDMIGYEMVEDHLPEDIKGLIKKQPWYKERAGRTKEEAREREIAEVIEQAEKLGLKVTR